MDAIKPTFYKVLGLLAQILEVPQHVAFVMDGNRRFARHRNQMPASGHQAGYSALRDILEFCFNSGVKEVSVYAFSIENFKRPKEEVESLMEIASDRIQQIIDNNDLAMNYGVQIKIIGDLALLPEELQQTIKRAEIETKGNKNFRLNICMPYTSRDDLTHAIRECVEKQTTDIGKELYTADTRPLDLLIRTSGTSRLSDFYLWELNDQTAIHFVDTLWPQYTPWDTFKSFCALQTTKEREN